MEGGLQGKIIEVSKVDVPAAEIPDLETATLRAAGNHRKGAFEDKKSEVSSKDLCCAAEHIYSKFVWQKQMQQLWCEQTGFGVGTTRGLAQGHLLSVLFSELGFIGRQPPTDVLLQGKKPRLITNHKYIYT